LPAVAAIGVLESVVGSGSRVVVVLVLVVIVVVIIAAVVLSVM
jgi:hypothetical protein